MKQRFVCKSCAENNGQIKEWTETLHDVDFVKCELCRSEETRLGFITTFTVEEREQRRLANKPW